jgi:phage regulator Rha-like protein
MKNNSTTTLLEIIENEPRISHRLIAEQTDNSQVSIRKLIDKHTDKLELFGRVSFEMTTQETAGGKQETKTYYLNEPQATLLLTFMRNNEIVVNFKVRLVNDFFKMREILKGELKPKISYKEKVEAELLGLGFTFDRLRLNEASKVKMMKTTYKKLGLTTSYLPKYSEEDLTYSLTHLLKKYEVGISTKDMNLILIEKGILEVLERSSRDRNGVKTFKSLTEKGLKFGKNLISPHNQLETQPHYFESKFGELLELISEE